MTEIEKTEGEIKVLQAKLELLKEMEKHKPPCEKAFKRVYGYYQEVCERSIWIAFKKGYDASKEDCKVGEYQPTPQKSEKEQRTKSPVEECYKDWWGQYPETGTWDSFDDKRWQGFQAGYEFAYAISTAKEVMEKVQEEQKWDAVRESVKWCEEHPDESVEDYLTPQERGDRIHKEVENEIEKLQEKNWYVAEENDWKTVALLFGKKLPVIPPYGYDELSPNAWYMWVVFNYDYYIKQRDIESGRYPTPPQTPEQIEKSLRKAFKKVQQTEEWKETQRKIDAPKES